MNLQPDYLYHIYNRGNNRSQLFLKRSHYFYFLLKIEKEILPYCYILAYCLMPTHYHFLIVPKKYEAKDGFKSYLNDENVYHPLTRKIGSLQSSFSQVLNNEFNEFGSRFQQKVKSKLLNSSDGYPLACFHYIHQNPLKANLVTQLDQWEFSSYKDYAGLRPTYLIDAEITKIWLDIPTDPIQFIKESMNFIIQENYAKYHFLR